MTISDENTKVDNNINNAVSNNILCKTVTSSDKKTVVAEHSVLHFGIEICANCGKEGSDVNNVCNKCNQVHYCNATCKKKHRHKHKKECEEHVRILTKKLNEELRIAAELHDEELFKQPPPAEDCPLCFLRIPTLDTGWVYMACCGKVICSGCAYAPIYDSQGNLVDDDKQNQCPFCRVVAMKSEKEIVSRYKKRVEVNDSIAIYSLGNYYRDGLYGLSQDRNKALELYHRAGELGYADAYTAIGYLYNNGDGVKVDKEKAIHYYELAAIGGDVQARYNLGNDEAFAAMGGDTLVRAMGRNIEARHIMGAILENKGIMSRALKHYMLAARDGHADSLRRIQRLYIFGQATKEEYTNALQSYQEYLGEIKSKQRDEAAAASEKNSDYKGGRYY